MFIKVNKHLKFMILIVDISETGAGFKFYIFKWIHLKMFIKVNKHLKFMILIADISETGEGFGYSIIN